MSREELSLHADQDCLDPALDFLRGNASFNVTRCPPQTPTVSTALLAYTYLTPVILVIGLGGNCLSLRVFLSKNMRKLSASTYLVALSTSDIMALLFYVLVEWLRRGLPVLHGHAQTLFLEQQGVCQVSMYLSYVSRFLSAWFIVTFTVERYIGVCHPLRRKDLCGSRCAQKVIGCLVVAAALAMVYKPALLTVDVVGPQRLPRCMPNHHLHLLSYILDSVFGSVITLVPFIIITVLNTLIIRKLLHSNRRHKECHIITEESIIKLEFTVILLVVSFVFVTLNLPYFCMWSRQFLFSHHATTDHSEALSSIQDALHITRLIFYMNYCVNFFLYSVTGAYFRKELRALFAYRSRRYAEYGPCSRNNSNNTTPQSWV